MSHSQSHGSGSPLKYVIVFRPGENKGEQEDSVVSEQLLLHHAFEDTELITLSAKLGKIGIIQALWTLSEDTNDTCKTIETEQETMITIKVEGEFYITLAIGVDPDLLAIPNPIFEGHLWNCYHFFTIKYGDFTSFEKHVLTDLLNEHFVSFWNDLYRKPESLTRNFLQYLCHDFYKVADLDPNGDKQWEATIIQDLLVQTENYLGIKDILVYNIPSTESTYVGKCKYGLIRNFCNEFEDLGHFSNWLQHIHTVFGKISSHVLAENVHYELHSGELEQTNSDGIRDSNDLNLSDNNNETDSNTFSQLSTNFMHNLTLPITFAYDAIQEVGNTTGINNSVSLFMNYLPKWQNNSTASENEKNKTKARYGYLISPLAFDSLPKSYKLKKMHLKFNGEERKPYHVLFWYYNDVLVVIICNESFDNIWSKEYLNKLNKHLENSIKTLYDQNLYDLPNTDNHSNKKNDILNFAYLITDKKRNKLYSSFPDLSWFNEQQETLYRTTLELVSNGLEQLRPQITANELSITTIDSNKQWGLDIMGNIFSMLPSNSPVPVTKDASIPLMKKLNFLDKLNEKVLRDISIETLRAIETLSQSINSNIQEEKLLRTSDGILLYIRNDCNNLTIILKNWIQDTKHQTRALKYKNHTLNSYSTSIEDSNLFKNLGPDVISWYSEYKQILQDDSL